MNDKSWQISRRTMLKGLGAMMGLPLLEAMRPLAALSGSASPVSRQVPVRLAVLYMPNGVHPEAWTPIGEGSAFELSPVLAPLAQVKKEILVCSELMNAGSIVGDGHYVKTAAFLTGTTITKTTGSDLRSGGVSMDQVAAQRIGNLTPLPSLELGIEPVTTGVDTNVGYTRLYGSHIAWSTPTTPLAREIDPQLAFDRLFRSGRPTHSAARAQADQSVLDVVMTDARQLRGRLGKGDQQKLAEYLDSVRAVEKRIAFDAKRRAEEYQSDPLVRKEIELLGSRVRGYYHPDAGRRARRHARRRLGRGQERGPAGGANSGKFPAGAP